MTKNLFTLLSWGVLVTLVTGLFPFLAHAADLNGCGAGDGSLNNIFCGITNQFSSVPRLLSMCSWVAAVILMIIGLFNLKEYGDDPSRTPMKNIIIKFVVAVFLVSLPFVIEAISGSLGTGKANAMTRIKISRGHIGGDDRP